MRSDSSECDLTSTKLKPLSMLPRPSWYPHKSYAAESVLCTAGLRRLPQAVSWNHPRPAYGAGRGRHGAHVTTVSARTSRGLGHERGLVNQHHVGARGCSLCCSHDNDGFREWVMQWRLGPSAILSTLCCTRWSKARVKQCADDLRACLQMLVTYPINAMRNMAMLLARTELVYPLHIDFVVSGDLSDIV